MELNVSIDHEAVNKAVAEAILKSALGEQLEKAIKKEVESLGKVTYSSDSVIERVVRNHLSEACAQLIEHEYKEQIRGYIREKVTEEFLDKLMAQLWERFIRKWD